VRVFLDTNVLVAAVATRGICSDIVELVIQSHELLTCDEVMIELRRILQTKFKVPDEVTDYFIRLIHSEAEIVSADEYLIESPDPDDTPIINAALDGNADAFVTGDKALLELTDTHGLVVVSPRGFAALVSGKT